MLCGAHAFHDLVDVFLLFDGAEHLGEPVVHRGPAHVGAEEVLCEGPVYERGALVVSVDLGDDVVRMLLCELAEPVLDDHGFA